MASTGPYLGFIEAHDNAVNAIEMMKMFLNDFLSIYHPCLRAEYMCVPHRYARNCEIEKVLVLLCWAEFLVKISHELLVWIEHLYDTHVDEFLIGEFFRKSGRDSL